MHVPPDAFQWPPLTQGILIRRYKRFLVDVLLDNGDTVVAHCPNSGSMRGLIIKGIPVFLSRPMKPGRKTAFTLEMIQLPQTLVGVHTQRPNDLVKRAILHNRIPELHGYVHLEMEKRYGANSRIDILLHNGHRSLCFVEIKNCTLVENGVAYFPDAVTQRGKKHLMELQNQVRLGNRAVMFYLVHRMDAHAFRPADTIDPLYGQTLRQAIHHGVEILVWDVDINDRFVRLRRPLPSFLF